MKNLTEIICIVDRSGSMQAIKTDVIGNFNSFLEKQKNEQGEAKLTLVLFDNEITTLHDGLDLKDVPNLTNETYAPNGYTALYDAVGITIDNVGKRLASTDESERPDKVLVVILTDGQENSSKVYTNVEKVKEMVTIQKNVYSWSFIFLGANQDAIFSAKTFGISKDNAMFFSSVSDSANIAFTNISSYVSRSRSMSKSEYSVTLDSALLDSEKDARS